MTDLRRFGVSLISCGFVFRLFGLLIGVIAIIIVVVNDGGRRPSRSLLNDCFTVRSNDFLGTSVQFRVFDQTVAIRESGPALIATVGLFALKIYNLPVIIKLLPLY